MIRVIKKITQNRLLHHSLFWVLSFGVLLHYFKVSVDIQQIDVIYTSVFHISILLAVYINNLYFIPKFLSKSKWMVYIILIGVLILLCSQLNIWIFDTCIDYVFPGYFFIAYYELGDMLIFTSIYVFLTTLLKLSKAWFRLMQDAKEKKAFELKNLKSQVNPHFLLNSLNSLYALALNKSQKTPQTLLKLSEMMQYTLYESEVEKVDLQKEINFINHYIDLQKLRIEEERLEVSFKLSGAVKHKKIAPLLLIPLVENAFKHGVKGDVEQVFVEITLEVKEKKLLFNIKNNRGETGGLKLRKYQGVGLENLKRRLEIIYPNQHQLIINKDNLTFEVKLLIQNL